MPEVGFQMCTVSVPERIEIYKTRSSAFAVTLFLSLTYSISHVKAVSIAEGRLWKSVLHAPVNMLLQPE